jgi:dGTPase
VKLYRKTDWDREVTDEEERDDPWRSPIGRDYGRIIHSASFRRLQGKTQVFPGHESDFFRSRLTHSLKVAQIAEGIAERLNYVEPRLKNDPINERLCAAASLVHDLGHPPFGHNGERALDDAMKKHGGFEGNAQTLRILSKLEKKVRRKQPESGDDRAGLNLTYRLLAGILKYDREIPLTRGKRASLVKGYYQSEAPLVERIKEAVCGRPIRKFKTLECSIMDVADDIAYSTYDLEDALKASFLTPASILASTPDLLESVASKVSEQVGAKITGDFILSTFIDMFSGLTSDSDEDDPDIFKFMRAYSSSQQLSQSAYLRTNFSSQLVHEAINCVQIDYNQQRPALSLAKLSDEGLLKVEILKQYTFQAMIYSSRVKLPEFRGYEVVRSIFDALASEKGELLLPDDIRAQLRSAYG